MVAVVTAMVALLCPGGRDGTGENEEGDCSKNEVA